MKNIENGVTENTSGGMFQASARKTLDIIVAQCNLLLAAVKGLEEKIKVLENSGAESAVVIKKGKVKALETGEAEVVVTAKKRKAKVLENSGAESAEVIKKGKVKNA